jgi:hypothetical protein
VTTFPTQKPKPFNWETVAAFPVGVPGCYGLFCRDRWVYIGTGDIRQRLLAHLDGDRPWLAADEPTHWVCVETVEYEAHARDLVVACGPICPVGPTIPSSSGGLS